MEQELMQQDESTEVRRDGQEYSMVRYIRKRIKNNKNFLATITGPTGSGKSWTTISIAQMIDPNFTVDNIIFKARDLLKLINTGNLKPGSVIVWDEAGIDLSNRNWQSLTNKLLNALLQTFRHKNFILLFTVPYHDFVDSASRKLFHGDFETVRINKTTREVIIKPKLLQYNSVLGKWYRKYLRINSPSGKMIKIKKWAVPAPSPEIIRQYEERKNMFTKKLNIDIEMELNNAEPTPEIVVEGKTIVKPATKISCKHCGNTQVYHGKYNYTKCRNCKREIQWEIKNENSENEKDESAEPTAHQD